VKRTVGLTGGIGSGKSTVAARLQALGAQLIDTDAISRQLTAPGGAAIPALRQAFGDEVIDAQGALDRAAMRARAFHDVTTRQRLEAVLHPLIGAECTRQAALAGPGVPVVFDVPLLAESRHWRERVPRVWVVDCDEATQIERVMQRSGWSREAVQAVIAQQAPRALRRAIADAVIHNQGLTLAELHAQVDALHGQWLR
jgi:dephospho-CoA kinase